MQITVFRYLGKETNHLNVYTARIPVFIIGSVYAKYAGLVSNFKLGGYC